MNPIIVVTGGSKGIGRAVVEKFAAEGFDIITCARTEADLVQLQTDIQSRYEGITVHPKAIDLSSKSAILAWVEEIQALHRPVEVLVNNAGVFAAGQTYNEPDGLLENLIATNLYSAYHLTRGLIDSMITQHRGHIFNLCSVASIMAYPSGGGYSISKFALYGLSKALREELKPHGIRVTAVLPGATLTPSWDGVNLPQERFIKPEDIAESIWATYRLSERTVVEEIVIRPLLGDL
jgi:short-subunit dehydrogenase